ncbi:MAG: hypothetical protein M1833_007285 [Piccolia ochrophora]|nr:MAG: hypothetical protein M1833_007285 [Piccolia ochrophora]
MSSLTLLILLLSTILPTAIQAVSVVMRAARPGLTTALQDRAVCSDLQPGECCKPLPYPYYDYFNNYEAVGMKPTMVVQTFEKTPNNYYTDCLGEFSDAGMSRPGGQWKAHAVSESHSGAMVFDCAWSPADPGYASRDSACPPRRNSGGSGGGGDDISASYSSSSSTISHRRRRRQRVRRAESDDDDDGMPEPVPTPEEVPPPAQKYPDKIYMHGVWYSDGKQSNLHYLDDAKNVLPFEGQKPSVPASGSSFSSTHSTYSHIPWGRDGDADGDGDGDVDFDDELMYSGP